MSSSPRVLPRSRLARLIGAAAAATAAAAALASVTACSSQPTSVTASATASDAQAGATQAAIAWGTCPALAKGATRDQREKCGRVTVPLNYQDPSAKTITIEVSEIATAKPGKFRGYLLLNPGGPGLEGLDMPSTMAPTLPASVLGQYDLIGFDPRGVGHSTPMSCGLPASGPAAVFPYPAADGSIQANIAAARTVAMDCARIGTELQYFTTANTARDMDRIRMALGAAKISYWGQSYGTYLGAVYTALFPQHTDRMVLEGNVDPNDVWRQETQLWNRGMNQRFPDAARVAAADNAQLGLGRTVAQVTRAYLALASQLDQTPAAVPGTQASITGAELRDVTYELLLHNSTLTPLTEFWKAAADLAAGRTLTATDTAVLQQVLANSPAEPGVPEDNQVTMFMALVCGDVSWSRDVAAYAAATAAARTQYPLGDGMPDNIMPCAFWSKAPIEPTVTVTSNGPRDILLLQNERDNATPWAGALGLAQALGSRAGFVGVDNGGHYVYGVGSTCADQATIAFLTQGTLPVKPLSCPAPTS